MGASGGCRPDTLRGPPPPTPVLMLLVLMLAGAPGWSGGAAPPPAPTPTAFELPAPARLLVENMRTDCSHCAGCSRPAPASAGVAGATFVAVSTHRPRFSFAAHGDTHPGTGTTMTAYRITVYSAVDGAEAWDSGVTNASAAVAVACGVDLPALGAWRWHAQWFAGARASPVTAGAFDTGPIAESDWAGSLFLGAGQREFRFSVNGTSLTASAPASAPASASVITPPHGHPPLPGHGQAFAPAPGPSPSPSPAPVPGTLARLYVASPGGSVVYVDGVPVGGVSGVSAWSAFHAIVPYRGHDLTGALTGRDDGLPDSVLRTNGNTSVRVGSVEVHIGGGFWTAFQAQNQTGFRAPGLAPVARVLLVLHDTTSGMTTVPRLVGKGGPTRAAPPHTSPAGADGAGGAGAPANTGRGRVPAPAPAEVLVLVEGRRGAVLRDDPWSFPDPARSSPTIIDWWARVQGRHQGWGPAEHVPEAPAGYRPPARAVYRAIPVPPVADDPPVTSRFKARVVSVQRVGARRWLYNFSQNMVGQVVVKAGSYTPARPSARMRTPGARSTRATMHGASGDGGTAAGTWASASGSAGSGTVAGTESNTSKGNDSGTGTSTRTGTRTSTGNLTGTGTGNGNGNITLHHCENMLNLTTCVKMSILTDQMDVHMLAGYPSSPSLRTQFTWHGFQHVMVEASEGVTFDAAEDSIEAVWTAPPVDDTAHIEFEGPGAHTLSGIRDIVKASQISNVAAYVPTDCPTREKHGWLGDALAVAEEGMYNLGMAGIFEFFLDTIRADQAPRTTDRKDATSSGAGDRASDGAWGNGITASSGVSGGARDRTGGGARGRVAGEGGDVTGVAAGGSTAHTGGTAGAAFAAPAVDNPWSGFVPMVVPGRAINATTKPEGLDISWTAAYPLIAGWLHTYYGDTRAARTHWEAMAGWTDAQLRQAAAAPHRQPGHNRLQHQGRGQGRHRDAPPFSDGSKSRVASSGNGSRVIPSFWSCGDWCAPDQARAVCAKGTGPTAAAANYILAVASMAESAAALGPTHQAAARKYKAQLPWLRKVYAATFGNKSDHAFYASNPMEAQALSAVSLSAGAVSEKNQTHGDRLLRDGGDLASVNPSGNPRAPNTGVGLPTRARVVHDLAADVAARGYHLTVGSVGQKHLLAALSDHGHHDSALRLALQTTYPSWGYWLAQGATTCWENWSGVSDASHPSSPDPANPGHSNPPTHNHVFLCGGVGEWLYKSLAGITPLEPGSTSSGSSPGFPRRSGRAAATPVSPPSAASSSRAGSGTRGVSAASASASVAALLPTSTPTSIPTAPPILASVWAPTWASTSARLSPSGRRRALPSRSSVTRGKPSP